MYGDKCNAIYIATRVKKYKDKNLNIKMKIISFKNRQCIKLK